MPLTESGIWVPNLAPKQLELFNEYRRYILCSGPRKSAKTRGVQHRIMRHAWEAAPRTRTAVLTKTIKNAKVGSFDTLVEVVAKEWAENLDGFRIIRPLSTDGVTKMPYFRVSNRYGGESEIQLHSCENDNEIAAKLKNTEFSAIWVAELTNFRDRKIFDLSKEQLRMPGVPYDNHLWISDTNPDEDDGDQFWAYDIWYKERLQQDHPFPNFRDQLCLREFELDDNPFLDPREIEDLKASYRNDPDMYAVYVEGRWIQTSRDSIFSGTFSPSRHVITGDDELIAEDNCTELYTGWDPGDVNLSCHIMEKVVTPTGVIWKSLDELVEIGGTITLADFSLAVCDLMDEWEERVGKKVRWIHYSDEQAVNRFRSHTGTYDQLEIFQATAGRIRVEGVPKFSGSQRLRVKLVRQLLNEGRIYISGRCPRLIGSLGGGLKRDKSKLRYLRDNEHKHPFDSFSYVIQAESAFDLMASEVGPNIQSAFSARL